MQEDAEEVASKFKNLNKSETAIAVWPLLEPAQEEPIDSVKVADNKKWRDAIGKDLQVQEAITVVRDLK